MRLVHLNPRINGVAARCRTTNRAKVLFNASSAEPVTTMDLATAYARVAGVDRVSSVELGEAVERFGFFGRIMSKTMWISSQKARDLLGWAPQGPPLFDDLFVGSYATLNVAG